MINNMLKVEIERLLRNPDFKRVFDKKLFGGFKKYYNWVIEYDQYTAAVYVKNPKCKRFLIPGGQKKTLNLIKEYIDKIDKITDKTKQRFITDTVVSAIFAYLKLVEINVVIEKLEKQSSKSTPDSLGFTGVFLHRMIDALEMMEDLGDNFDVYVNANPSVADCKYIEVGLRRLMAAEVDEVV